MPSLNRAGNIRKNIPNHFTKALFKMMVESDISINRLENKSFRSFIEKFTKHTMPNQITIRRQLNDCYDETMNRIRGEIGNHNIWLTIDESLDCKGRSICNVIIGSLKSGENGKQFLLNSIELTETINHNSVIAIIDDTLRILWPNSSHRERFLLLITDGAHYMKKAGKCLKGFYPKMLHITCMAHLLHRLSETIRNQYDDVNRLIANVKKIFSKSPSRVIKFRNMCDLALPPKPVITRWGTWLNAAFYYG